MKIDVIANLNENDVGLVAAALSEEGLHISFRNREEVTSWSSELHTDLLISLGSSWSVYWDNVSNNVAAETALMRHAICRGIPFFGICFGAQLLSHSFGGRVERGDQSEIGWHDVVASGIPSPLGGRWMQWHHDRFTAPSGFKVLATNGAGIQAMCKGRSLGVQFHPEATEEIVSRWIEGDGVTELAAIGLSPLDLINETRREATRTTEATAELMRWFLETVAQRPFQSCEVTNSQSLD